MSPDSCVSVSGQVSKLSRRYQPSGESSTKQPRRIERTESHALRFSAARAKFQTGLDSSGDVRKNDSYKGTPIRRYRSRSRSTSLSPSRTSCDLDVLEDTSSCFSEVGGYTPGNRTRTIARTFDRATKETTLCRRRSLPEDIGHQEEEEEEVFGSRKVDGGFSRKSPNSSLPFSLPLQRKLSEGDSRPLGPSSSLYSQSAGKPVARVAPVFSVDSPEPFLVSRVRRCLDATKWTNNNSSETHNIRKPELCDTQEDEIDSPSLSELVSGEQKVELSDVGKSFLPSENNSSAVNLSEDCQVNPMSDLVTLPSTSSKRRLIEGLIETKVVKESELDQEGNSSSVGSSLVEESVTSWLASTSDSLLAAEERNTAGGPRELDLRTKYVSGTNSGQIGPVLPDMDWGSEWNPEQVVFMADGHYWVDTQPLSLLEDEDLSDYKAPSRVSFSSAPIRQYSTFSVQEYDRKNEFVNPAAASAEYEMEKRIEVMELYMVELYKEEEGLGLSVMGTGTGAEQGQEKLCIYVKSVTPGGLAHRDGRIHVNDLIVEVNGEYMVGVSQAFAAAKLREVTGKVSFLLGRDSNIEGDMSAKDRELNISEEDFGHKVVQSNLQGKEAGHGDLRVTNTESEIKLHESGLRRMESFMVLGDTPVKKKESSSNVGTSDLLGRNIDSTGMESVPVPVGAKLSFGKIATESVVCKMITNFERKQETDTTEDMSLTSVSPNSTTLEEKAELDSSQECSLASSNLPCIPHYPEYGVTSIQEYGEDSNTDGGRTEDTGLREKYEALVRELEAVKMELREARDHMERREIQHHREVAKLREKLELRQRGKGGCLCDGYQEEDI